MTSIELIPAHADDLSSPSPWLRLGILAAPRQEFSASVAEILSQVTKPDRDERWGAFWATESFEGQVRAVGLCSFKAEPSDLPEVEIAYFTFPHREGRGIATAMVRELTETSFAIRLSRHRPHASARERVVQDIAAVRFRAGR